MVKMDVSWESHYNCDLKSRLEIISTTITAEESITCNGITVSTADTSYDVILNEKWGHEKKRKERVTLTNYTVITTFNNGLGLKKDKLLYFLNDYIFTRQLRFPGMRYSIERDVRWRYVVGVWHLFGRQ